MPGRLEKWSEYKDSNLGPPGPKPGALPDCATLRLRPLLYLMGPILANFGGKTKWNQTFESTN